MIIYPAIDIIDSQCVRLRQGDFSDKTTYNISPLALAQEYASAGSEWLHMVDLDAAKGNGISNLDLIAAIAETVDIKIQAGGGVRSADDIEQRLATGIQRVIIGSIAVEQTEVFCHWLQHFGPEHIVAALDVQNEQGRWLPAVHGWQQIADCDLFTLLEQLCKAGLKHLLCTDIGRDGMLQGPNIELYQELQGQFPHLHIQASGGVHELQDVDALLANQFSGVIIGKALLDRRFSLSEALQITHQEPTA